MSENSAFLIRAKPHGQNREGQFKSGTVSIGWPVGRSYKGISKEDIKKLLDVEERKSGLIIKMISSFLTIRENDYIITPSIENKNVIHIFKVESEYEYQYEKESAGNPHTVRVKLLKSIDKSKLSRSFASSIAASRKTLTPMTKHIHEISGVLEGESIDKKKSFKFDNETKIKAEEVLVELLESDDDKVRLGAAKAILLSDI